MHASSGYSHYPRSRPTGEHVRTMLQPPGPGQPEGAAVALLRSQHGGMLMGKHTQMGKQGDTQCTGAARTHA